MAVSSKDSVLQRGDATFRAPLDVAKVAAGIVPITINFVNEPEHAKHPNAKYLVLLGARKNEPYKGKLAFPTGKVTKEELKELAQTYGENYGGRPVYSARDTARREMREELGMSKPSALDQLELERGTEFVVVDKATGFTIYITPMLFYQSEYGKTLQSILRDSKSKGAVTSDLSDPRFHTIEEIADLQKKGMLAPIVYTSIAEAFRMLEDRRNSIRKVSEDTANFTLSEKAKEREEGRRELNGILKSLRLG